MPAPCDPSAHSSPRLTPSAHSSPRLTPSALGSPRLTPSAHGSPRLTPSALGSPRLTPLAHGSPRLTPLAHGSPRLTPSGHGSPRLTPSAHGSPRLTPSAHGSPRLPAPGNLPDHASACLPRSPRARMRGARLGQDLSRQGGRTRPRMLSNVRSAKHEPEALPHLSPLQGLNSLGNALPSESPLDPADGASGIVRGQRPGPKPREPILDLQSRSPAVAGRRHQRRRLPDLRDSSRRPRCSIPKVDW